MIWKRGRRGRLEGRPASSGCTPTERQAGAALRGRLADDQAFSKIPAFRRPSEAPFRRTEVLQRGESRGRTRRQNRRAPARTAFRRHGPLSGGPCSGGETQVVLVGVRACCFLGLLLASCECFAFFCTLSRRPRRPRARRAHGAGFRVDRNICDRPRASGQQPRRMPNLRASLAAGRGATAEQWTLAGSFRTASPENRRNSRRPMRPKNDAGCLAVDRPGYSR